MHRLEGRVALITGASSGVGLVAAEEFARAGADVALVARGREGLERAAAAVEASGRRALVLPADVTDQDALGGAVARTEAELGRLDVLVPNAAATIFGRFEDVGKAEFDRVVEVSFLGVVATVRAALPALQRTRGVIAATGSLNARVPLPAWSSYAAAKFAERGFLHTLRLEQQAAGTGVRVGIVHPGAIDTPVWETTATATGRLPRRPPVGYRPRVIARALVAMAADPSPEVTIGAEAAALGALWTHLRPAGDLFWRAAQRYSLSGRREGSAAGALWEAAGRGRATGGLVGRPSLWAPVRMAARPGRLGRAGLRLLRK